jgi:hypothetical protein
MTRISLLRAIETAVVASSIGGCALFGAATTGVTNTVATIALSSLAGNLAPNLLSQLLIALHNKTFGGFFDAYNLRRNHHVWQAIRGAQLEAIEGVLKAYEKDFPPPRGSDEATYITLLKRYLRAERRREPLPDFEAADHLAELQLAVDAALSEQISSSQNTRADVSAEQRDWATYLRSAAALRRTAEDAVLREIEAGVDSHRITPEIYSNPSTFQQLFRSDEKGWFSRFFFGVMVRLKDPRHQEFKIAHDAAILAFLGRKSELIHNYLDTLLSNWSTLSTKIDRIDDRLNDFAGLPLRRRHRVDTNTLLRFSFWNPKVPFLRDCSCYLISQR